MKISPSGGMSISTAHTILTASETAGEGSSANKGPGPPDPITITINALAGLLYPGRLNSDGNYYGITFPGDYISDRSKVATDPFWSARSTTGAPIDYAGTLNVILNIPIGMSIGANTSGNFGSETVGSGTFAGAKYELRKNWDPAYADNDTFGHYLSDPSLVINLDTDEWDASVLAHLNITVNNYGNTIGAGGSGGWGGSHGSVGCSVKKHGGGGGGGGQGLHPTWSSGTKFDSGDSFSGGAWVAGQGGALWTGASDGAQGTIAGGGAGGAKGGASGSAGTGAAAHTGGTAIYVKSNVATSTTGTTLTIYNGLTGRMYGGGGGGGGGYSSAGGTGGDMTTGGSSNFGADGADDASGHAAYKGGLQGSILWVDSANLAVTNTITNDSSISIAGWDGTWT